MLSRRGASPRKTRVSKARSRAARETASIKRGFLKRYGFAPKINRGEILITRGQQRTIQGVRLQERRHREQKRIALQARAAYVSRKRDYGKVIMIGVKGTRDPQKKGKKGYAVYVTTSGKLRLLKSGYKRNPYKARRLREIELPLQRNLHKRVAAFKLATIARGKATRLKGKADIEKVAREIKRQKLVGDSAGIYGDFKLSGRGKGRGRVKTGGNHDFNNKAVNKLARDFRRVIKAQRGQRAFNIQVLGLIELPDKTREVFEFTIGIARNDADAIRLGGIENFVRQKFYAFMARELAFRGFVTMGSANHIRRLADNDGQEREEWVDRRGQLWAGRDLEVVNLLTLEWKIEQAT